MSEDVARACRESSLEDVRQIDVHDSGAALTESEGRWDSNIVCMCQHRQQKQTFATCDAENNILIWRWLGTEKGSPERQAVKPLGTFSFSKHETVYHMCFRSDVPKRVAEKGGFQMIVLSSEIGRHWFSISVVSVFQASHKIEHIQPAGVYADLLPRLKQEGAQINFFTTSYTDQILVMGGQGLLQFYAITDTAKGATQVTQISDMAQTYADIKQSAMVSCLSLPPPMRAGGILDWIVIGASNGKLYGFRLDMGADGKIEVNQSVSGRFRSNTHTQDVPVRSLIATYGDSPFAHHKAVQARGLSYSMFLNRAPVDEKVFYSMGEDGKLLTWRLLDKTGWTAVEGKTVQNLNIVGSQGRAGNPMMTCHLSAGHSSRLVPSLIVLADEKRKLFVCYDRCKPDEVCSDAMCHYLPIER
jgi:hypothetical protein